MVRFGLQSNWPARGVCAPGASGGAAAATAGALLVVFVGLSGCGQGDPSQAQPVHFVCGEVGVSPGQFAYPRAIDRDDSGLWIIDKQAMVQRLDPRTGDCLASFQMPESDAGKPTGVTVAPWRGGTPALYIPDTHYFRVMVYPLATAVRQAATPLASFGGYGKGPGQFIYPTDVAVLPSRDAGGRVTGIDRIFVSEYGGNDRVSAFGPDLVFRASFGEFGEVDEGASGGALRFNRPQSLALDARPGHERLVIADASHHRLVVTDLEGRLIRAIGGLGREPGRFTYPYGLAMLDDGSVLVAEFGGARVQRIDVDTGLSLGVWGEPGRDPGHLANPWGVAVIGREAYVLDSGNNRVQGFELPRGLAALAGNASASGMASAGGLR